MLINLNSQHMQTLMMNRTAIVFTLVSILTLSFRSDKPAYSLYDSEGKNVKYDKMIEKISAADVVFFGEHCSTPFL